jgi:hypothetical protein
MNSSLQEETMKKTKPIRLTNEEWMEVQAIIVDKMLDIKRSQAGILAEELVASEFSTLTKISKKIANAYTQTK